MAGKEDFVAGRNPTGDEELGEFVSALLDGEVEHLSDQTLSELVEAAASASPIFPIPTLALAEIGAAQTREAE